ncbi:hypothetical protein V8B55DRAFT_1568065 [Mucor lusitanicus]|uniref:Secreted protein n=1 Tax=Mucor circinelloides f. lusitanicus TaxID=29924 RepID=A0A8H4EX82_MUCCL|nr:hypothetical protein FB192DRAFT_1396195 [Mucor lusitanicus]
MNGGSCQWTVVCALPCLVLTTVTKETQDPCCASNPEKAGPANRGAWKFYATKRENPSNAQAGTRLGGGDVILEALKKRSLTKKKSDYFGTMPIILD